MEFVFEPFTAKSTSKTFSMDLKKFSS